MHATTTYAKAAFLLVSSRVSRLCSGHYRGLCALDSFRVFYIIKHVVQIIVEAEIRLFGFAGLRPGNLVPLVSSFHMLLGANVGPFILSETKSNHLLHLIFRRVFLVTSASATSTTCSSPSSELAALVGEVTEIFSEVVTIGTPALTRI